MRKVAAAIIASFLWVSASNAGVITFDELDAASGDIPLEGLNPYQGFEWKNFLAYTAFPGFDGYNNGIVSAQNAAYAGGELAGNGITPVVGSITSATLFDFSSASLGAGWYDNLSLTLQGSRAGSVLFSQTVTVGTTGAQLFQFAFNGIDTLTFSAAQTAATTDPFQCGSFNCTQFTLDDFTFAPSDDTGPLPEPVPEPATALLLAMGAGLLAPSIRRKKQR